MSTPLPQAVLEALRATIDQPCLQTARALEDALRANNFDRQVFGRVNQKSSIEAASESDRGIVERMANAFDASLTAARLALGIERSDRTLTPRNASQKFFCARPELCDWAPTDRRLNSITKPTIEFWPEPEDAQRFRKHRPSDGLATVLIQDHGTGIARERMAQTILTLNSEAKLKEFEAIGQFGHGGSSALAFCESCLIMSAPRTETTPEEFFWTLVFPESEPEESKQSVIRRWFSTREAHESLSEYRGQVSTVITSPPYLDVTNFEEDQWLQVTESDLANRQTNSFRPGSSGCGKEYDFQFQLN